MVYFNSPYQQHTLPNGLRIIALPTSDSVLYCGYAVKAGSRHELSSQEGLAHICEHLTFKGTSRRSAVQIINAIEGAGGELNAFTNKEETVFYAAVTVNHLRAAIDVLSDMVFHSQYPQQEVEKECEVVCDEIESYEDSPAELIFDEFENILFKGHPLGHPILGTAQQVRSYTTAHAREFAQRYYRPDNCVFFISGQLNFTRVVSMVAHAVGTVTGQPVDCPTPAITLPTAISTAAETTEAFIPAPIIRQRDTHQAHVMVGSLGFAATDERRWVLYLLNNILGGPGLNSRLNLSLRERNALVYTVDSTAVTYSDTGLWAVYFGCDQHDVKRCLQLVHRELDRLAQHPLSPRVLTKAKRQMSGQLTIASDNREQYTLDFAKDFLQQGKERHLNLILDHINSVTAADIQQTAQELFAPSRLLTLIYE